MRRPSLIREVAWTSFAAGALCALMALGALLPLLIPEGRHPLCVEVDLPWITLHWAPDACAPSDGAPR